MEMCVQTESVLSSCFKMHMKGMALLLHVCLATHQTYLTIALSEDTAQKRTGCKRNITGAEANERKRCSVLPPPLLPQTTR